jgi:hypothetical protein
MMARRMLVAALLALGFTPSVNALRVLEAVERPVELSLQSLTLPSDMDGTVRFRACATCTVSTHSVTADTTFVLNTRPLPLAEFLAAIAEIRTSAAVNGRAMATVFLDVNTDRVTRVTVHAPGAP